MLRSHFERGSIVSLRFGIITGLVLLAQLARAQSQPPRLELDWHAPDGCPTASEVQSEVTRLVGSSALPTRQLFVRAEAKNEGFAQWTLTLQTNLEGTLGERSLAGKSCRAVTDAAVLTLALTLNPELRLPEATRAPAEPGATNATAGGPWTERGAPPSTSNVPQPHKRNEPIHGLVSARAGLRAGAARDPYGEFGLSFGVAYEHFHSALLGSFTVDGNAHSQLKDGAGANFWEVSLASVNCYSAASGSFDVAPCLGLDWTRVHGHGYGFDERQFGTIHWFSALFGASLGWQLHPFWWLRLDGYGLVPLRRPAAFAMAGGQENLLHPHIVGAEVDFGLEWQLW